MTCRAENGNADDDGIAHAQNGRVCVGWGVGIKWAGYFVDRK